MCTCEIKTTCLTVIHPGIEDFIEEYLQCIHRQTFKNFDLVIINDHFPLSIENILKSMNIRAKVFNYHQTPQENRLQGLKICQELGYDIIVCSDADDIMFDNKIETIINFFLENEDKQVHRYTHITNFDNWFYFDKKLQKIKFWVCG